MTAGNEAQFPEAGIGERLRRAREDKKLSIADVGRELRMPVRVVESLEAENWSRLGAPVFVRGQLRSYARLLGLPVDSVIQIPELAPVTASELKPRTYVPPMRRFADQAARRAVYIVVTLALLVPVWNAMRQQMPVDTASNTTSLDGTVPEVATTQPQAAERPRAAMRASITPLPTTRSSVPAVTFRFEADSWVEIVGSDGEVLESGIVPAGQTRNYDAGDLGRVKLGNASGVSVLHEGSVQDLAPYLRGNVARFTVSSDGSLVPPLN